MPSKLDKKEEAMNSRSIYLPVLCVSLLLSPLSLDSQAFDINNPGPSASGDWTIYPGSYNSQRYSPLKQVNLANVHLLQVKWVYHVTGARGLEPTPAVKDGVMYIPLFNRMDAVDARTGNILWRYQQSPASTAAYRGTSVYDGKVFVATTDAHLLALDARNGAVVWDVPVDGGRPLSGAAPFAANGKIIVGVLDQPDGSIQAYDAKTGSHAWTWHAIPKIGEPESKTWSDGQKQGGAAVWMSGSFDPEQNVVIYGTGQPNPPYSGEVREGDNLYSDCIVALDVDTGKLKWYFQTTPHDQHDWDAASGTLTLFDAVWQGKPRKLLMQNNRNGFFFIIDRTNGEFVHGYPFIDDMNWATGLTREGRPILVPGIVPSVKGTLTCPSTAGATNWPTSTYSPDTGLIYFHAVEGCGISYRASSVPGAGTNYIESPEERTKWVSHIRAFEPLTGKLVWDDTEVRDNHYGPGLLSTAGGLLFAPEQYGQASMLDARTGKRLWHFNTGDFITAGPITYLLDGRQYFAIASGTNIFAFGLPDDVNGVAP
jgi:alcohol dehydrogenase (cytochrome c)